MQNVIIRFKLKKRLYIVTNNNVVNILTMHTKLNRLLRTSQVFDDIETNVYDVKLVSCFAYMIQLILQKLFDKIKIKLNVDFKTS